MTKPNLKSQNGDTSKAGCESGTSVASNNCNIADYITDSILDIKKLLPPSLYSAADSQLDIRTVKTRYEHEGLAFITGALPMLSAGLFRYFETGQVCYPSFKIKKGTVHPCFLQGLFRLACSDGEYQVRAISFIYQISVMFKKLKGPYPESVLSKQHADFVATDESLLDIDLFSSDRFAILERAREEIKVLFLGFSLESRHILPRPGPGATNDKVAKHLRYRPHVLYTQIDNVLPYVEYFNVHGWDVVKQTARYLRLIKHRKKEPRARMKYVYKKVGEGRGICIEQNEMQFFQQAFMNAIYNWVEKHPMTRGQINFTDQSINALLALAESKLLSKGTIDMKGASDRVPRDVVSWGFQDTVLHDILMALSTRWIDFPFKVNGKKVLPMKTNKYAAMGSGLCFPIMAIIHWALIRAIVALSMPKDHVIQPIYVYGDDIIAPKEYIKEIYAKLPLFGMKINEQKSYYLSRFRESCGMHAFNGESVTPVFIKNLPVSTSLKELMSCIDVEHQLYEKGFYNVAHRLRTNIRALTSYNLPYVGPDSAIFGFKRDSVVSPSFPGKVKTGFDSWGNPVLRTRVISPIIESERPPTEEECYLRHMLTKATDREVSGNSAELRLIWKTLPVPGHTPAGIGSPFMKHFRKAFLITGGPASKTNLKEPNYDYPEKPYCRPALRYRRFGSDSVRIEVADRFSPICLPKYKARLSNTIHTGVL